MKALIAAFGLLASVSASADDVRVIDPTTTARVQNQIDTAWSWACLLQGMDCRSVPKPVVNYDSRLDVSYQGAYMPGTATVNIALDFYGEKYAIVILVHEMTHYLQYIAGGANAYATKTLRCDMEREAFKNDEKVGRYLGLEDHPWAFTWESVESLYGCTPEQLKR